MRDELTKTTIKLLCGKTFYARGEAYYFAGKVMLTNVDQENGRYEAKVQGSQSYEVVIDIDQYGDVEAECTCPAYVSYDEYCKHIAAVMINVHDLQHHGRSPVRSSASLFQSEETRTSRDLQLINRMIGLFNDSSLPSSSPLPFLDQRELLEVEFTCQPVFIGNRKYLFGIEMKVGTKRLYVVQKIREFLDSIDRRNPFVFSKHFTYNPKLHIFQTADDVVIQQLIKIVHNEKLYSEIAKNDFYRPPRVSSDRMILVPPFIWEELLPLLVDAPAVKLKVEERIYNKIQVSDEAAPIQFELDEAEHEGFQLHIQGLEQMMVMDLYGVVLYEGTFIQMEPDRCKRLSELKQLFATSRSNEIQMTSGQMDSFVGKVIPGLMKLGNVRVAAAVSDRIVKTPLKARLYLDRLNNRLLAGVEFQYGDIVINPLEGNYQKRDSKYILMRDGHQEQQILNLMDQSLFTKTEGGYFMQNEEAEFDFLYEVVPQLEQLMEVYATTAVKDRLFTGQAFPKVKVDVDERTDWLICKFNIEGIPESEVRRLLESIEEKRKYYRLPNGSLLPLEGEEFQEINRFMNETDSEKWGMAGNEVRLPVVRGFHLLGDSRENGNTVQLGTSLRELLESMRNPSSLKFSVPERLQPVLRDYQEYGFQWLNMLAHFRFGGILADDMGLGKTLQSISFIVSKLPEIRKQKLPAIIVSPASLVYNWRNEMKKFAPEIRMVIVDGSKAERFSILQDVSEIDVMITSYPLLLRDIELYRKKMFHTLILDEAQAFKNYATQTAKAVKKVQAKFRFALTGTPVENTIEELWSIFNVVFPELLPDRKAFKELSRETVAKQVRPFLLRRLKTDVLKELPEKIETLQASELLPDQKKLYMAYLAKLQQETLKHLNEGGLQKNRIKILAGITRLRQLCCHPALFVEGYKGSAAKFEQLIEILQECRNSGKRVLIFSQFTKMLNLIGRELGEQGVPYFYLDGQTPASERVELCSRFNDGERDLFLISLKAGGTGLNLTGADTVILYDLWWNPAVEQQAADRAHRIGQKNVVQVIRLITEGTVEEKMYELQRKKKDLIEEVIQPGHESLSSMTEEEIREMLMI